MHLLLKHFIHLPLHFTVYRLLRRLSWIKKFVPLRMENSIVLRSMTGGFYFFHLLDRYAAGYSMLFAVLFEAIAVSWIYGTERFCNDIKDMVGFAPGFYWRVCWILVAPIFLMFIIVYGLMGYEPLSYENYVYPQWANILGWIIAGSSVIMIPGIAIYQILNTPGTFYQRLKILTTPWSDHPVVMTNSISMNGIHTDPAQIRLTSPQAAEEV